MRRTAAGPGLALFLAGVSASAQDESRARAECTALVERAQALPSARSEAELLERASSVAREARRLEAMRVRGVRLRLPWLAELEADMSSGRPRSALEAAARQLAERLFFTCGVAGEDSSVPAAVDRARLLAILSRPEFERHAPDDTALYQLLTRAAAWLRDFFSANDGLQATATSVRALFLLGACAFAAFLALRMARAALGRARPGLRSTRAEALALDDPEAYRERLGAALESGDGREAIRLGLLTLLAELERARLASPGRAATNRELAEQIAVRGGGEELSRRARELLGFYDRAWYGLRPVSCDEARAFVEKAAELRAALRGAP